MSEAANPAESARPDDPQPQRIAADAPMTTRAPSLSVREAERLAEEVYGVAGTVRLLSSERDQNFYLAGSGGEEFLLRISNPAEPADIIDFQNRALSHIAQADPSLPVPRLTPTIDGESQGFIAMSDGPGSIVRLFTYLEGVQARGVSRTRALRQACGASLARLDAALVGFDHPAAQHDLLWNIAEAHRLAELIGQIAGDDRRRLVARFMERFETWVRPRLHDLRAQVIHNDLNLYNVLVSPADSERLTGIIDFGDIVRAPLVCEVATAAAYQMAEQPEPLAAAAEFIAAYEAVLPLTEAEREVLFDLTATRHMITVLITEWRAARNPENRSYILRHNPEAWEALAAMGSLSPAVGREALLRSPQPGAQP